MTDGPNKPPETFTLCGFTFTWLAWMNRVWLAYWLSLVLLPVLSAVVAVLSELQRPQNGGPTRWAEGAFLSFAAFFLTTSLYGFVMFTWIAWKGWARPHWLSVVRALAVWSIWAVATICEGVALVLVGFLVWQMFGGRL